MPIVDVESAERGTENGDLGVCRSNLRSLARAETRENNASQNDRKKNHQHDANPVYFPRDVGGLAAIRSQVFIHVLNASAEAVPIDRPWEAGNFGYYFAQQFRMLKDQESNNCAEGLCQKPSSDRMAESCS